MKRLRGYTRMSWERQIDGIEISLWVTPGWKYAYLYENGTGTWLKTPKSRPRSTGRWACRMSRVTLRRG